MRNDIPSDSASNFGARVRETLMTYLGKQGDPLDRGLTIRDLVDSGFASLSNFQFGGGSAPLIAGPSITDTYVPDLTPPPIPTGFTATAAISNIIIECDAPIYTQGHGHRLSRIYGATRASGAAQPVFAAAVEITQFAGAVTSYATNPSTEWHLWIKWESIDGVLSASPAGGTNGFVVTTGQDVALLLEALTGELTEAQLYNTLSTRINLIDAASTTTNSVAWRVAQESTARASAISSEATTRANAITNEASARTQAILDEAGARATADGALQTQINTLSAASSGDFGELLAAIQEEQTARTTADTAEATTRSTLATQLRGAYTGSDSSALSTGIIYNERQSRITAEGVISTEVSALTSTVTNNYTTLDSAITSEQTTRANADTALTTSFSSLSATVGTKTRTFSQGTAPTATATGDLWFDTSDNNKAHRWNGTAWVATDDSRIATSAAAITSEQTARATADTALTTSISQLTSTVTTNKDSADASLTTLNSAITSEATTRATADTTLTTTVNSLTSTVTGNYNTLNSAITNEASTRAGADSAAATTVSNLTSTVNTKNRTYYQASAPSTDLIVGDLWFDNDDNNKSYRWDGSTWVDANDARISANTAAITSEASTRATADTALSDTITTLSSTVTGNYTTLNSAITTEASTRASADTTMADSITTLQSTVDGNTAAISTEATTRASVDGGLLAQYTVKADVNGYVSGFGLASTANNAGATSSFAVRADSFYIASPSGPGVAPTMPFIVRTTSTTIGGVEVPVGVYITDGYIQNGTITNAKIANLAVDSAKIYSLTADKIIAGSISVGQYIQSSNYVSGSSGWKINGDGAAEFGSAAIRGQLVASQINSAGLSIKAADGTVILSAGSSVGASSFTGNVTGSIDGTAASTVVSTANTASSTANTANATADSAVSAASTAQTTADTANTAAATAQSTANTANSTANTANSAAATAAAAAATAQAAADAKLAKSGAQILTGPVTLNAASAITVGTPALNGAAGANGFYIGSTGIVGTQNGLTTFALDNAGNATFKGNLTGASGTFGGNLAVGSSPAISGTTMSGSGAIINSGGTFAIGSSTANITFTGGAMRLNGNVVDIENLIPGAALPNYVRTYKGSVSPTVNVGTLASNTAWGPLAMDATALNNKLGATDYDAYRTLFPAGTYFYELSVPVKNNTSDTNDATYTALVVNPPGGVGGSYQNVEVGYDYDTNSPIYQSQFVSNPYTVISTAGVNVVGDWQTATIFGVGRFTLASATYLSAAVMTTEANNMNVVARTGFCTLIWRVWRAD